MVNSDYPNPVSPVLKELRYHLNLFPEGPLLINSARPQFPTNVHDSFERRQPEVVVYPITKQKPTTNNCN